MEIRFRLLRFIRFCRDGINRLKTGGRIRPRPEEKWLDLQFDFKIDWFQSDQSDLSKLKSHSPSPILRLFKRRDGTNEATKK